MKIVWTREALNKLIEIADFIAQDSPKRAEYFMTYLIDRTNLILNNPEIGRIVPEISTASIRELLIKNYRLVYRIKLSGIEILTVFEGHRLFRRDDIIKNQ